MCLHVFEELDMEDVALGEEIWCCPALRASQSGDSNGALKAR